MAQGRVLSTRAVNCLRSVGVSYPPTRHSVQLVWPLLCVGTVDDRGHPRTIHNLGMKTLAEIERWMRKK